MATISLQCNSLSKILLQTKISMTGRAYMGENPLRNEGVI